MCLILHQKHKLQSRDEQAKFGNECVAIGMQNALDVKYTEQSQLPFLLSIYVCGNMMRTR